MPLSPENYIRARARKLPIHECMITEFWEDAGMATILVSRIHTNEHITFGIYLVDLFCLGVKDTIYQFNIPGFEYNEYKKELIEREELSNCDYILAHNIIYGSVAFADEFGKNGKPMVMTEVGNEPADVISQLEKTAGPGNYDVIYIDENGFYEDDH